MDQIKRNEQVKSQEDLVKHQAAKVLLRDHQHLPDVQPGEILFLTSTNTLDLKDEVYSFLQ